MFDHGPVAARGAVTLGATGEKGPKGATGAKGIPGFAVGTYQFPGPTGATGPQVKTRLVYGGNAVDNVTRVEHKLSLLVETLQNAAYDYEKTVPDS